jgi:cytochrome c-type biogenesis protein CcsB
MSTAQLGAWSTMAIYAAMAAYAVALVAFAVDLSALRDRGPSARARRGAAIGLSTTTLGAAFHLAGVALRGLAAGRVPWANMYEFTTVFSLVMVLGFLVLARRRDVRYLGALVVGPALLALGLAVTVFFVVADGVQPALQSYWLVIHVAVATISVGVLSLGAAFSVLQLVRMRSARADAFTAVEEPVGADSDVAGASRAPGALAQALAAPVTASRAPAAKRVAPWGRLTQALPSADELERLAYRFNAVGFVLWTFTLVAGAIWAEAAWGRYWGWDAKEVWTFVIWVVYAGYLHARSTRGWSGRRAATFALVGYACVLLNFFVVNLTFTSLHTYSGL